MDQESFRKLLQTPKAGSTTTPTSRGSLLAAAPKSKKKTIDASQPAFKPRTLKKRKDEQEYRDRATERRLGIDHDYAQVEALAEDFERRNADNADREAVEEQRRYLGGDSAHSILVKGLDYSLYEQERARLTASATEQDDTSLEQAFLEVSSSVPRKRTREEILQELKAQRGKSAPSGAEKDEKIVEKGADVPIEEAKKAGKFRPIGFKSIGEDVSSGKPKKRVKKVKKVEGTGDGEMGERKKRRKVEAQKPEQSTAGEVSTTPAQPSQPTSVEAEAGPSKPKTPPRQQEPEPEPITEDFDIFADAGEYTGVDLGSDDDESEGEVRDDRPTDDNFAPPRLGRWVTTDDDERPISSLHEAPSASHVSSPPPEAPPSEPPRVLAPDDDEREEGEEEERPVRLQPLASSALPSIRELLELDEAENKADKRRARKEKKEKRGGGGGDGKVDKDKIERDYKRLKAYTDKKSAAEGSAKS